MCIYKSRVSNVCIGANKTCNATYHKPPRRAPETTRRPAGESPQIDQNIEKKQFLDPGIDLRTKKVELHTLLVQVLHVTDHEAVVLRVAHHLILELLLAA